MKFLLDTNVIINLEDDKELSIRFTRLLKLGTSNNHNFLIHPASKEDIRRDNNNQRKKITLTKLSKYAEIESPIKILPGLLPHIKKPNDEVDFKLISQLQFGFVDYLITEDKNLKKNAIKVNLGHKILNPIEAYNLLIQIHGIVVPNHPVIHHASTRELLEDLNSPFFDSLRLDYDFDNWFITKCAKENRQCYFIKIDERICALLIYNIEKHSAQDHPFTDVNSPILKLCTLKVDNKALGKKIGELFINKMLHFAIENEIDHLYVTTFPKQRELITLFNGYGFKNKQFVNNSGETEYALYKITNKALLNRDHPFENTAEIHPFYTDNQVKKWIIPIEYKWYNILFKDAPSRQTTLFDNLEPSLSEVAGNSIRKAYISRSTIKGVNINDIIYFYLSGKGIIETIGIVDEYCTVQSTEELRQKVKNVSVYQDADLDKFMYQRKKLTIVIFRLVTYLKNPIDKRLFNNLDAYKAKFVTISRLSNEDYALIKRNKGIDERFIIN